jgi:hypothetical protein
MCKCNDDYYYLNKVVPFEQETKYFKCKEPFSCCSTCPELDYWESLDIPICDLHKIKIINKKEKILLNEEIKDDN